MTTLIKELDGFVKGLSTSQAMDACKLADMGILPDELSQLREV